MTSGTFFHFPTHFGPCWTGEGLELILCTGMALDEVKDDALYEVEEDKDNFGDTFPLVLDHVGLGEGLALDYMDKLL